MTKRGVRTEKRAPEGGWGFLIAIGLTLPCSLSVGGMHSFGLIFNGFLTDLGAQTSAVTIIMGSLFSAQSFSALFAGSLIRKFSMRSIGTVGALLYFVGNFLTIFVTSVEMLIITYGILQGIGLGLMIPIGYTNFNHYFVERRVLMMSVTQAMKGIVITSHPILSTILMDMFGFRGTLAIFAAINAHCIFGMLAMHPVEWHLRTVKVSKVELKPLMDVKKSDNEKTIAVREKKVEENLEDVFSRVNENTTDNGDARDDLNKIEQHLRRSDVDLREDLIVPAIAESHIDLSLDDDHFEVEKSIERQRKHMLMNQFTWSGISRDKILKKLERSKSVADPTQLLEFDPLRNRIASIMSLSDFGDAIPIKTFGGSNKSVNKPGCWQKVVEFLDLNLMKDLIYVNIVLGISFTTLADNTTFPLLPMFLDTLGFNKKEAAKIISVGAGADLLSRISLAILSICMKPKARYVFIVGAVSTIIMRSVLVNVFDYFDMMIAAGLMGFFRTLIHVPVALIFADHLPPERFAAGYGLFMFLQGNFTFIFGPIFGWVRDLTGSYVIFFHLLSLTTGLSVIPWLIEIIWTRMNQKKINIIG